MSVAARAGCVAVAFLVTFLLTTAGCNSVFRFDQPAPSTDGGPTDDAETDAAGPRPCADDTTCGTLHCKVATGSCVACVADTNCSGTRPKCDTALGVCVECNGTNDCPARHGCDTVTKRCLDLCFNDDDPCPVAGFVCDADRTLCVECKQSENCAGSANGPVCDVPIGRCVECTGNAKCPSSKPVCDRRTGRCEACVTSAECDLGSACDPATLTCRPLP